MKFSAIILAAGSGKRTGLKYNKVLYEIHNKRVIDYSIDFLSQFEQVNRLILVVSNEEFETFNSIYKDKVDKVITGGKERQDSVYKALGHIDTEYVLIHDGARPFIPDFSMKEIFDVIKHQKSMTLAVPVKNSIFKKDGKYITESLDRKDLVAIQTPQVFHTEIIKKAHELAKSNDFLGTDDTMLVEKYLDIPAYIVKGDYRNIKLTTLDDINLLEVIL